MGVKKTFETMKHFVDYEHVVHNVRDCRVHVVRAPSTGPGPNLLFVHGLAADASHFYNTAAALRNYAFNIFLIDLPGHGLSGRCDSVDEIYAILKDTVAELLAKDAPNIIVGNSLGGAAAAKLALDLPDYVTGIFLISPGGAPFEESIEEFLKIFRPQSLSDAVKILERVYESVPKHVLLAAPYLKSYLNESGSVRMMESILRYPLFTSEDLAAIRLPVYLLWGDGDTMLPSYQREFFLRHLPAERTTADFPEKWSHCPQLEHPSELADKISAFCVKVMEERSNTL